MTEYRNLTKFQLIDLTHSKYTELLPKLKSYIDNFNSQNQLYTSLLFEFSYAIEMMYQDNDEDLYNTYEIDDKHILKSLYKCLTATTRLIHFFTMNDLLESKKYKYYDIRDILDLIKLNYYRLRDEN